MLSLNVTSIWSLETAGMLAPQALGQLLQSFAGLIYRRLFLLCLHLKTRQNNCAWNHKNNINYTLVL